MGKITEKQKKFVEEYLIDLNATQAAIRAGYSSKNASRIAIELLNKTHVLDYLRERQKQIQARTEITQDKVINELAAIAFANGADFAHLKNKKLNGIQVSTIEFIQTEDLSKEKLPAIAWIKNTANGIEVKTHDKVKALELLGKHLGLFNEKPAEQIKPIEISIVRKREHDD